MKPIGKAGEPGDPKLKSLRERFGKNKKKKKMEERRKKTMAEYYGKRPGYAVGGEVMPKAKPC